jgi:DNA-binding NarL/FixJ family response regulator
MTRSPWSAPVRRTVVLVESPFTFSNLKQFFDLSVILCKAEPSAVVELCEKSSPCILIAEQDFILSLPLPVRQKLRLHGDQIQTLAVCSMESCQATELLHLGCSGVIREDISSTELHRVIDALTRGELWYPRIVLSDVIRSFVSPFESKSLTRRETEILQMISQGHSNSEIANSLFISKETVRWHQRSLYSKIGTRDRKQVAAYCKNERRAS